MINGRVTIRIHHPDRVRLRELLPNVHVEHVGQGHLAAVIEAVSRMLELPGSVIVGITISNDHAVDLDARIPLLGPRDTAEEFHSIKRRLGDATREICPDCGISRDGVIDACSVCGWFIDYDDGPDDDGYLRF